MSFWHHIGKNSKKLNYATIIENETDENKIAEQFFEKYKVLNDKFCLSEESFQTKKSLLDRGICHVQCKGN